MGERKLNDYSIDEYIELEHSTGQKYEYTNGWINALAGGTLNHGIVCMNVSGELRTALKGKNCMALNSEIKIYIDKINSFVYPDSAAICGEVEMHDKDKIAVTNPVLIVEVLSESTFRYDKGDKFIRYRMLDSFQEYVLVYQDSPIVEVYYKGEDGRWDISSFIGLDAVVELSSIGVSIEMKEIYLNVKNLKPPQYKLTLG